MSKIIWEGNQEWDREFPDSPVPEHSVKINRPDDILKASLPYSLIAMGICFLAVLFKKRTSEAFIFDLRYMPVSFLIGFSLIPVHEFLHAICYPKAATVYVGVCLKKLAAYALSSYPLSKCRYIFMSLVPMILGVIPLGIFVICPLTYKALLTVCVVPAFMGLISPSPDYMDVIAIIRQVPNGAKIQATNDGLFWFK